MYRIVARSDLRSIDVFDLSHSEQRDRIELYKNTIYENFPELTYPYMKLPIYGKLPNGIGYVFNIVIDCKSNLPVVVGCDDFKFYKSNNMIETIPNTVVGSPVLVNVAEIVEWCKYLRKRYHEILKDVKASEIENKIADIKNVAEKWEA